MLYDLKIATTTGVEFQAFFERIMEKHEPSFQRVKPSGSDGDWKSDGYTVGSGTVFQCYAPDRLKISETICKIAEDFAGATRYWGSRLKRWVFVLNHDALPPRVLASLVDLKTDNEPRVQIEWITPSRLWESVVSSLPLADLDLLLGGLPPSEEVVRRLRKSANDASRAGNKQAAREFCDELLDQAGDLRQYAKDRADAHQLLAYLDLDDGRLDDAQGHVSLSEGELEGESPAYLAANGHRLRAAIAESREQFEIAELHYRAAVAVEPAATELSSDLDILGDVKCLARVDHLLQATRQKRAEGFELVAELVASYALDHLTSQDGQLPLRVGEGLISYYAYVGRTDEALRALALIDSACTDKELAHDGATILQRLTGRTMHMKATEVALACAQLSADLAKRADETDSYWAAQANLVSVYLSSGRIDEARRQMAVLDPVLRNEQIDPQLKAGILTLAAALLAETGSSDQAAEIVERAQRQMRAEPELLAQTEFDRGRYLMRAGRAAEALLALKTAVELARKVGAPGKFLFRINAEIASAATELGAWDDAATALAELARLPPAEEFVDDVVPILQGRLDGVREMRDRMNAIAELPHEASGKSLQEANAEAVKPVLTWWREALERENKDRPKSKPEGRNESYKNLGILYDYWGGGSAARIIGNLRQHALTHFTPIVDVRSVQDIRRAIRALSLVSDCLVLLWKGRVDTGRVLTVAPFDYVCGGNGYIAALGDQAWNSPETGPWVPMFGDGAYLPAEVVRFLATEALPLMEQGRLFIFPAPAVGCANDAFGTSEHLLAEMMSATPLAKAGVPGSAFPLGILPYFEDAPFGLLADLVAEDSDAPRRLRMALVKKTNELRMHGVVEGATREIADEIADALAALDSVHRGLERRGISTGHDPLGATATSVQSAWSPILTLRRLGYRMSLQPMKAGREAHQNSLQRNGRTPFGGWLVAPGQHVQVLAVRSVDADSNLSTPS